MKARNNIIAYILSLIVELGLVVAIIFLTVGEYSLKFGWAETVATVTDVAPPDNEFYGSVMIYENIDSILTYEVDGITYEQMVRFDRDDERGYYSTLPIKYNPKNPDEYILESSSSPDLTIIILAIILPFSIIGNIVAIVVNIKRYKKRKAQRDEEMQGYKLN